MSRFLLCRVITALVVLWITTHVSLAGPYWERLPTDSEIQQAVQRFTVPNRSIVDSRVFKYHDPTESDYPITANGVGLVYRVPNPDYDPANADQPDLECGQATLYWWPDRGGWVFVDTSGGRRLCFSSTDTLDVLVNRYLGTRLRLGWIGESPPGENQPPTVILDYRIEKPTPEEVIYYFKADASDPDGDPLTYEWYVDGIKQEATSANVRWRNPEPGTHTIRVVVSDSKGGTAEDSVEIPVGVRVEFVRLETGKSAYAPGDIVKVIYELTNPGTAPADYHVEYVILDPSGKEVYKFTGRKHTISPGENQPWQSTKWVIPADAVPGEYMVQARCISTSGVDEEGTFFEVISEEIEVSYTLGYDMPLSEESKAVPLRVRFRLKEETGIIGIVSISISEQKPEVFIRYPRKFSEMNRVEYEYPGVRDAQYDFYIVKLIEKKQTVRFVALLRVINELGEEEEREVPFTVNIEAAFTVYATRQGIGLDGRPTSPLLNGNPLPLNQWIKGDFGDKLRLFQGSRVWIRELSGLSFAIGFEKGSPDLYWEVALGPWNLRLIRNYFPEDISVVPLVVYKIGSDIGADKTLELLFKETGKKISGPLGIILDVFEDTPTARNDIIAIRVRSTVGVTIAASGDVTLRNFEGSPEIIQPDGSVLALPVGHETKLQADGSFTVPVPYDPSSHSVRIWEGEIGPPAPPGGEKTIEQAIDADGDGIINDLEMLQALQYWIKQQIVPGTNKTIDDLTMLSLLQRWIKGTPVR